MGTYLMHRAVSSGLKVVEQIVDHGALLSLLACVRACGIPLRLEGRVVKYPDTCKHLSCRQQLRNRRCCAF